MAEIVWMTLPISFHLREKIGSVDALVLGDRILDKVRFLAVNLVVVCPEKGIDPCCNTLERLSLCCIGLI